LKLQPATKFKPGAIGAFYGLPMADYLAAPGLSSSSLKILLDSPLTFKRKMDGMVKDKPTDAMALGSMLHSSILEGRLIYRTQPATYGDGKKWNWNAAECKAWGEAHKDMPILTEAEAEFVKSSFTYVITHPKCSELISGGKPEVSVFAKIDGRLFKGRFDYYTPTYCGTAEDARITDLKSVADASSRGFASAAIKYGWHLQAALYCKLAKALGDGPVEFNWIALQKGNLPLVNVKRFGMFSELVGNEALQDAIDILTRCEQSGVWPEWRDDDGTVKQLDVPDWAMKDDEALDMEN